MPRTYPRRMIKHDEFFRNNLLRYDSFMQRYPFLAGGVFHATSPANYEKIIETGAILPYKEGFSTRLMPEGKIDGRHRTWARHKGYVSLLDFHTANQDELVFTADRWPGMIEDQSPYCVLLELRLSAIHPKLITFLNSDLELRFMHIPYVESYYPESIPISLIERAHNIYKTSEGVAL